MKTLNISVLIACFFSLPIAAVEAEEFVFNFNESIPPEFTVSGNGTFSQSLNSSIVYSGLHSLQVTTSRGFGPNAATTTLTLSEPIQRVSFAIYDEFAGSSPFYMYFFAGTILAWQDSPLSDNVLIYGGSAVPTARTVGWHTVVAEFAEDVITYTYDGNFLGTFTAAESLELTSVGWSVDSASGGNYSIYIDDVVVQTVPEPTINALLITAAAFGAVAIIKRRRRC